MKKNICINYEKEYQLISSMFFYDPDYVKALVENDKLVNFSIKEFTKKDMFVSIEHLDAYLDILNLCIMRNKTVEIRRDGFCSLMDTVLNDKASFKRLIRHHWFFRQVNLDDVESLNRIREKMVMHIKNNLTDFVIYAIINKNEKNLFFNFLDLRPMIKDELVKSSQLNAILNEVCNIVKTYMVPGSEMKSKLFCFNAGGIFDNRSMNIYQRLADNYGKCLELNQSTVTASISDELMRLGVSKHKVREFKLLMEVG